MTDRDTLAGQFRRTLAHLQARWDVHYVPAGPMSGAPVGASSSASVSPAPQPQPPPASPAPASAPTVDQKQALRAQAERWSPATKLEYLRRKNVGDCTRCPLSKTRNHIVFGVGSPEAKVMFVGEAPGADEDRQGEPFVGRAGQRLNQWLQTLGLSRAEVYIANVIKCRPPGNRDPRPEEIDRCSPFLQAQIRAIGPKAIVALGRHAGQLLSRRDDMTLRSMRASRLTYDAGKTSDGQPLRIPLIVTYHPAWVLRQQDGRGGNDPDAMVLGDLNKALALAYPDRSP